MITKFNEFNKLNEASGFPNPAKVYSDIIFNECEKRLDYYINTKGKFYNYSDNFEIEYNDYKDIISDDNFRKFPVEFLDIKFSIILSNEYDKFSYSAKSYYLNKRKTKGSSYWLKSKTKLVEKSVKFKFDFILILPSDAKSFPIEYSKNILRKIINHELIHAYQFVYNTDMSNQNAWYQTIIILQDTTNNNELFELFELLYLSTPEEINAKSGETKYKILNEYIHKISKYAINKLSNFNADEYYNKIINSNDDSLYYMGGLQISQEYLKQCKIYHVENPTKWIVNLKNLTFKELLKYFEPYFHAAAKRIKNRISETGISL